jgi:MFS transporter, ACS family, glucarate transporter
MNDTAKNVALLAPVPLEHRVQLSKHRYRVLAFLILLAAITYIDRVCISVAGPRMQEDLGIDPVAWGWVTAMFTLSYGLFEIPTGALGDRIGPRRVLTRIVLWWSVFTSLTGAVSNYVLLLVTRFLFGAGEAGAYPNASIVIARWFPPDQRASISGVLLMATQLGGALAPLLVVPLQIRYGWRASFFVFGMLGIAWAICWYSWFRDSPGEKAGVSPSELEELSGAGVGPAHGFPWRAAVHSESVMAMLGMAFCYFYVLVFFTSWFHTFLVKGRGFSEGSLVLSTLPYVIAAGANIMGGVASDRLVRRFGAKWGRRSLGIVGLGSACLFTIATMMTRQPLLTVILLALVYGTITFQQSGVFGACLDMGGNHAGAVIGLMNTSAQAGGFLSSVAYGYIVTRFASYDAPFVPMAALLLVGALLWLRIDASREIGVAQTDIRLQPSALGAS